MVRTARETDAVVYAVVTGKMDEAGNVTFLERVAEETGGRIWVEVPMNRLTAASEATLAEVRGRYVLRYEPAGVSDRGWHDIRIRLEGRKGKVRVRRGYRAEALAGAP